MILLNDRAFNSNLQSAIYQQFVTVNNKENRNKYTTFDALSEPENGGLKPLKLKKEESDDILEKTPGYRHKADRFPASNVINDEENIGNHCRPQAKVKYQMLIMFEI